MSSFRTRLAWGHFDVSRMDMCKSRVVLFLFQRELCSKIIFRAHRRSLRLEVRGEISCPCCCPLQGLAIFSSVGKTSNQNCLTTSRIGIWTANSKNQFPHICILSIYIFIECLHHQKKTCPFQPRPSRLVPKKCINKSIWLATGGHLPWVHHGYLPGANQIDLFMHFLGYESRWPRLKWTSFFQCIHLTI